jgi:hypothetical protein
MRNNNIGIVELIDRTLSKGVILNADLIVTVADVPLLAANLKLALASVETMLKYGVMTDWLASVSPNNENMLLNPKLIEANRRLKMSKQEENDEDSDEEIEEESVDNLEV